MGTTQCVSGTVLRVENGSKGVTFLNFCKDSKACPFTVVVFPADLKKMGDIRQLEGRQIEIKGTIQDYDGRAEIVLRRSQQLGEAAFLLIPPVPTDYDVERAGHNSAGKFYACQSRQEDGLQSRTSRFRSKIQTSRSSWSPLIAIHGSHTNPLRNSSSGYLVPRHTMPPFQRVWNIERVSVYMNRLVLTGCKKK